MKNEKYILTIESPCAQKWSSMTNAENGKFCSLCAKNVTDFSKMSDMEIINFLKNLNKNQKKYLVYVLPNNNLTELWR